jgi:hypothetical protein
MDQRILELEQELELEENPLRLTWGATKSDETIWSGSIDLQVRHLCRFKDVGW